MNYWDNPFSNSSMLIKLDNGGILRISENRRIAWHFPETYISNFHCTDASYECSLLQHSYVKMDEKGHITCGDISDEINPIEATAHKDDPDFMNKALNGELQVGEAPIQIVNRLPKEFEGIHTGHGGTHKFMVDDFCQAYMTGKLYPTNAWQAAKYNLPGLVAHKSAMQGGVVLDILDFGEPPADLEVLSIVVSSTKTISDGCGKMWTLIQVFGGVDARTVKCPSGIIWQQHSIFCSILNTPTYHFAIRISSLTHVYVCT